MSTTIKDENGRPLLRINDRGRFVIARYPDMDEETKDYLLKVYSEIATEKDKVDELRIFLDFGGDEELCS